MTDRDNITLPREVVEAAVKALDNGNPDVQVRVATTLRTFAAPPALAAPSEKPDALDERLLGERTLATELRRLHAENEALRRDAERYRWLRRWMVRQSILCIEYGGRWALRKPHVISSSVGCGETEDAAIDAAMKEDKT